MGWDLGPGVGGVGSTSPLSTDTEKGRIFGDTEGPRVSCFRTREYDISSGGVGRDGIRETSRVCSVGGSVRVKCLGSTRQNRDVPGRIWREETEGGPFGSEKESLV